VHAITHSLVTAK